MKKSYKTGVFVICYKSRKVFVNHTEEMFFMTFKRKIYDKLLKWKELSAGTSAILLEGARSCRIREWAAMVHECRNRPSGMSVDEWCQANNITKANYYYRFAQVRKACLDSIPSDAAEHAITQLMLI